VGNGSSQSVGREVSVRVRDLRGRAGLGWLVTISTKLKNVERDFQEQLKEAVEKFREKMGGEPNVILLGVQFAGYETEMETLVSKDAPFSGFILYHVEA